MKAAVYNNRILAGTLEKTDTAEYRFSYDPAYLQNPHYPPVSLTLQKSQKTYEAAHLFPFFCGLLSEGVNKDIQCRLLKIDEQDDFGRLLQTAGGDTIGAITIKQLES